MTFDFKTFDFQTLRLSTLNRIFAKWKQTDRKK